jgi:hypothetical protein
MPLRFKLQLVVMADDQEVCVDDVVVLDKQHDRLEHIGLSLDEAKTLLLELQRQVVTRQIAAFLATRVACERCGRLRGLKDRKTVVFSNALRQSGARQSAVAAVFLSARQTVIDKPAGRVADGAHRARALVSGEQVVLVDFLRSDSEGLG